MRVAFILNQFPVTSQTFILDQITGLISRGVEIDIYALKPENNHKIHDDFYKYNLHSRIKYPDAELFSKFDKIIKFPKPFCLNFFSHTEEILESLNFFKYGIYALSLNLFHEIVPFLPPQQYDIVHAHFGPNGIKGQLLRDLEILNGKLITSFHGYDLSTHLKKKGASLYNHLFAKGDLFLPISNFWKDKLISMGCDKNKICVQHMGIDCNKFEFTNKQFGNNGSIHLVSIARLTDKKGLKYSIRAVGDILEQKQNIFYQIIGEGPLRAKLKALIDRHGWQNCIKLVGWKNRDEVIQILKNSDLLIAPRVTASDGDMEGIHMP